MKLFKYIIPIVLIVVGYMFYHTPAKQRDDQIADQMEKEIPLSSKPSFHESSHNHDVHQEGAKFAPQNSRFEVFEKWDEGRFSKTFPGNWKFEYPQGHIVQLTGGKIPLKVGMDGAVIELTQKIVAQFGIDPKQVSPQVGRPAETKFGQNLKTYQHYQGMLVYDASMTLYASKKNSEVSIIENGFRKIDNLDLTQKLKPEEVGEILVQDQGVKLDNRGETMIYVSEGQGVAAYRFEYKKSGKSYESLLSAETGEVLFTRPLFVH